MTNRSGKYVRRSLLACTALWIGLGGSAFAMDVDVAADDYNLALAFNDAINHCFEGRAGGEDELLQLFAEDAIHIDATGRTWKGRAESARRLCQAPQQPQVADRIRSVAVDDGAGEGDALITLRVDRCLYHDLDGTIVIEPRPHLQVLVVEGGRIARVVSVFPPFD